MGDAESRILVRPSGPIRGEVLVPGAKNSVLKLMAACLLAEDEFEITNVPGIVDVRIMAELLTAIGLEVSFNDRFKVVHIVNRGDLVPVAPPELVAKMRASINVLGPLLARCGTVQLQLPGGDDFGARPIDLHVDGLQRMGATFAMSGGQLDASADRLRGADIVFEFPSVGATENLLTAAVLADGVTTIDNAAREPEIIDLCEFLVKMGARIEGIGTSTLTIEGVDRDGLHGCNHETVPDRIQAATYIAACAVSGGELDLLNAKPEHMAMVLTRFHDMGLEFGQLPYGLQVRSTGRLVAADVATLPYPGIATDYKPLIITMLSVADGVGVVTENLYPGRFRYVEELRRLGADIALDGHHAVVTGVPELVGCDVASHDIRAGAAMVVAGLAATGTTRISGIHHIDRGYDDLVGRLQRVGADIERID